MAARGRHPALRRLDPERVKLEKTRVIDSPAVTHFLLRAVG
jgi:hypothetical protein